MNLANKLTILRICLIPVMLVVLYLPYPYMASVAAAIFVFAAITDILDGQIARKRNLVSNFGKIMDPIADKLIVLAALLVLLERGMTPVWVVMIIVGRELLISGVRMVVLSGKGDVIAASWLGKVKTVFQDIAVTALFLAWDFPALDRWYITGLLMAVALVFTLWSTVDYCIGAYKAMKEVN